MKQILVFGFLFIYSMNFGQLVLNPSGGQVQIGSSTANGVLTFGGNEGYSAIGAVPSSGDLFLGRNVYTKYAGGADGGIIYSGSTYDYGASALLLRTSGVLEFYGKRTSVIKNEIINNLGNLKFKIDEFGNVGISTINPQAKLDVVGKIISGSAQGSTFGEVILEGRYGQGGPYGSLITLGTLASSGNAYLGFGIKPNPYTSNNIQTYPFLSSTNLDIGRAGIELGSERIKFLMGDKQASSDGATTTLSEIATFTKNGVGIGTPSPSSTLHVYGGTTNGTMLTITNGGTPSPTNLIGLSINENSPVATIRYRRDGTGLTELGSLTGSDPVSFISGGNEKFRIASNGNIGIGTSTPPAGYKLAINGNVIANKVVVKQYPWADFVFKPDYKLPPLSMVEQHIKEKGHLPDIPSEKEVAENGIDLGSMDAKLLQKVEELTLYVIKQEKRSDKQERENNEMKTRIEELKKQNALLLQLIKQK